MLVVVSALRKWYTHRYMKSIYLWLVIAVAVVAMGVYLYPSQHVSAPMVAPMTSTSSVHSATATRTPPPAQTNSTSTTTTSPIASSSLIGAWTSVDDAKFVRTFAANGMVTDTYAGDAQATATGTWQLMRASAAGLTQSGYATSSIVRINFGANGGGVMLFPIVELNATKLQLINATGRGNILRFTRSTQ